MRRSRSATPRSLLPLRRVAPERGYVRVRPVFAAHVVYVCRVHISLASVQCVVMVSPRCMPLMCLYVSVGQVNSGKCYEYECDFLIRNCSVALATLGLACTAVSRLELCGGLGPRRLETRWTYPHRLHKAPQGQSSPTDNMSMWCNQFSTAFTGAAQTAAGRPHLHPPQRAAAASGP